MEIPSINTVNKLYNQEAILHLVRFYNDKLEMFSKEISKLIISLGETKELSQWPTIVAQLKKNRFELVTLPLPAEHIITKELELKLQIFITECRVSFPEYVEQLEKILEILKCLKNNENQFFNWLNDMSLNFSEKNISMCLLNSKYVEIVDEHMNYYRQHSGLNIKVTTPRELKLFTFYDCIIFCGSLNLFSDNMFNNYEYTWRSPRASHLYFLSYSWLQKDYQILPTLDLKPNKVPSTVIIDNIYLNDHDDNEMDIKNDLNNDIHDIDINFSPFDMVSIALNETKSEHYDVICDSRLIIFENDAFIYEDIESSSRIVLFNPQVVVKKILNKNLENGMSMVVRTEGSDDSITAVANMLFGDKSDEIRSLQDEWKIAFRKKLFSYSRLTDVSSILMKLGSPSANEVNIRNWQRNDTIKPKNYDDFKAIMIFSELEDMVDKYWDNAKKIDLMHKRAGKEISKLFLSKINDSRKIEFEKNGRIDIEIAGLTGKVSVLRIDSILSEIQQVPFSKTNKIMYY